MVFATRALVTGGAGFVGSHLVERLLQEGHEVVVLDNFSTGRPENLEFVRNSRRLTVNCLDITDHAETRRCFDGVQWVFHLAALADIVPSVQHPEKYHRANVDGTVSVLEAARDAAVEKFVYAASSSCYGTADRFPTPESAPLRPRYPYALTKYIGEQYLLHWGMVYKLPCVSLRLFNVYGPRSRTGGSYGAVFGVFLAQKLGGKPFTVVGDGNQTRDFVFVSDVVEAFLLAAQSSVTNEVFNVGSGNTYSINRLVALLGSKSGVVNIPRRPGEPDCTLADISRIRDRLGWSPKLSLEDGVRVLLEHIDYWRSAPVWDQASISEATRDWFKYLG